MTLLTSSPSIPRIGDLLERLGGIPADRVRYYPLPGTATEQDVLDIDAHEDRLCELVDGVLIEKPTGYMQSYLAGQIATRLSNFVDPRKLGLVTGAGGMMRFFPGMVRIPDVAYVSWERVPGGRFPKEAIPLLVPDLVVEVLSASNTVLEMERKRGEYFDAGVRLVWMVDPPTRTVTVYRSLQESSTLSEADTLTGDPVLPGLAIDIRDLFAEIDT